MINFKKLRFKEENSKTPLWIFLIIILILIAELFIYTWTRVQCVKINYEISDIQKEHQRLANLNKQLKIEFAHLKSPERISVFARIKGLVMPGDDQIIVMNKNYKK